MKLTSSASKSRFRFSISKIFSLKLIKNSDPILSIQRQCICIHKFCCAQFQILTHIHYTHITSKSINRRKILQTFQKSFDEMKLVIYSDMRYVMKFFSFNIENISSHNERLVIFFGNYL